MKNTMTKNITIRDIIYSRIDFIENNNIFDKKGTHRSSFFNYI